MACYLFPTEISPNFRYVNDGNKSSFFLGLYVSQSPRASLLTHANIYSNLKKYGKISLHPIDTPVVDRLKPGTRISRGFSLPNSIYSNGMGSLMYLTASRPDLVFVVCMCARYQAKPTKKHFEAIKRVFHADMRVKFKKKSVGMLILGDRLVSWSSKKQRSTAISTTKAEYIAMSRCSLSIKNESLFEGENEFKKLKIYLIILVSIRSDWEDLSWLFRSVENLNTMAEQNVPAQAPTRTDEQIVPRSQWLQIGKSNLLFDAQKIQKNPIFQISVDILRNTNFFRAFSASASVPAIYIQQFWNSMKYDEKTGVYCCQVDEQWFNLSADLLRKALDITPVDPAHPFELPPTGDTVIDFVNQLGYPEPVEFVSNIRVNYVYQPWRAILTLINQCLTGKTSGGDKPRHPVLQMLWGIVTQTNVDHAELLWEEFTQGIQTFFSHKASHKASLKDPKKKAVPLLIPYGRFTKMIIYYLGSTSDVHKRPESPCHLPGDDFLLGNLKFISKGETDEVFGMAIPKQLITQAIQQSSYYPKYLEMVAKNTKKTPQDSASKQPEPATKRAPPKKPTTTTPVKPTKPPSSKQPKSPSKKPSKRKLPQKVRKGKPSFQLVDEDDEAPQEPVPQGEGDDPDLELAKKMSLDAHQEKGEGEGADADIERAIKLSLDPSFLPQGQAPVGGVAIRDPVSETTPKLPEVVGKGKAIVTKEQVAHSLIDLSKKKRTTDQFILVRRDQAPHDSTTGPSSQPEDDTSEKVVHESSSTTDSERTESGTEAAAPKGPSFERRPDWNKNSGKVHVSLAGPNPEHSDEEFLATAYPKVTTPPITTEATSITTTLSEITPFIALQLRVAKLEQDMSEVKKTDHSAAALASIKTQVPTVVDKYLGTKLDDALLRSIKNQESKKSLKEIIKIKREQGKKKQESTYTIRSTDKVALKEFDLKNALFKHMNKNWTTNRNPANYHLLHALMEALIADEDVMDKEVKDRVKDHKRKHDSDDDEDDDDDEGPLAGSKQGMSTKRRRHDSSASGSAQPPPKDDEQSSKKPQDSDASASKQHPTLISTGWQITDTRDVVIDSSMHRLNPNLDILNIPLMTFQNKMKGMSQIWRTLITLIFPRRTGKKKLCKADLEGPAFNLVKAFHKNNVFLQFQMDECHKLLTNKLKAARYLDFGLEELVPSLWVESERDYDISAAYGITHWWFSRKQFYINKHSEPSDREAVRSQMRILSVIRVKTFEKYGYNYLREIILRRADYKEYKISEKDFKNLHPNDFEDLYLLNIQDKLNHLSKSDKIHLHTAVNMWIRNLVIKNRVGDLQLRIESYQTKLNLERPNWDATDYSFKEDYTIVPKPRAVIYRDRNDQRKLMRLNEIHKFSDGTLTRVMEKLDHMVKDFHLYEYNKGMETRKWSEDDKRRSKDFITAIEKRLQIRRIFRSLESFVGGRIRDIDYRLISRTTWNKALSKKSFKDGDGNGVSTELEEEERLTRQKEEDANIVEWDNVQAMIDADYELAARLQAQEQEELTIEERSKMFVELMDKRKKHFARLRVEEQRRKPPTKAQKRSQMSTYLKHMVGYKQNQLKSKNYAFRKLFDKHGRVNMFVDMDTELVKESSKKAEMVQESSSKRAGEELESDNSKKQKLDENVEAEVDDEAEMKKHMEIVPDDEVAIDAIPLATKPPIIVDWKIIKEGKMGYFQIIRADGSSRRYSSMIKMLQNIDREDLETLWKLVKAKHGNTRPEEAYERVLWGDLKVMFEPDIESEVWRNLQGYKVTVWKLFSSSGVHFVRFQNLHIFMLVEKKYPLTPATITKMLNKKLQADHWNEMCYQLLKLMTKQLKNPGSV
ncbi:hypothetical protein Tco_1500839 [Tanacetum coccineum]